MGCQLSSEEEDYLSQRRAQNEAQRKIAGKQNDEDDDQYEEDETAGDVDEVLESGSDDSPYTSPRAQRQKYVKRNQERMIMDSPLQRASRSQQQLGLPLNQTGCVHNNSSEVAVDGGVSGTPVNATATILGAAIVGANNNSSSTFGLDSASGRMRARDDDPRWSLISLENDPSTIAGSLSKTLSTGAFPPPPLASIGDAGSDSTTLNSPKRQSSSSILLKSPSKGTGSGVSSTVDVGGLVLFDSSSSPRRSSSKAHTRNSSSSYSNSNSEQQHPSPVSLPAALPPTAIQRTSTKPTLLKLQAEGGGGDSQHSSLSTESRNGMDEEEEHVFKPYRPIQVGHILGGTTASPPNERTVLVSDDDDDDRPLPAVHGIPSKGQAVDESLSPSSQGVVVGCSTCGNSERLFSSPPDSLASSTLDENGTNGTTKSLANLVVLPTSYGAPPPPPPPHPHPMSPGVFEELVRPIGGGGPPLVSTAVDSSSVTSNSIQSYTSMGVNSSTGGGAPPGSSSRATLPPPPPPGLVMPELENEVTTDPLLCLVSPKAPSCTPVQQAGVSISTPVNNYALDNSFALSNSSMSKTYVGGGNSSLAQERLLSNNSLMNNSLTGANLSLVASSSLILTSPKKAISFLVDSPEAATAMETPHGEALAVPVSVKEEERQRKKAAILGAPGTPSSSSLRISSPSSTNVEGSSSSTTAMIHRGGKTVYQQHEEYDDGGGATTPTLKSPISPSKRTGPRVLTQAERQHALLNSPISNRPAVGKSAAAGGQQPTTPKRRGASPSSSYSTKSSTTARYKERWGGYQEMVFDAQDQEIIFGTNAPKYSNRSSSTSSSYPATGSCSGGGDAGRRTFSSGRSGPPPVGAEKRGSWRTNRLQ